MTNRHIIKSLTLLAACSALTAQAGVTPAPPAAPAPAPTSLWTGSVTLGYDSDYIYRGVEVYGYTRNGGDGKATDLVTGALDLNYAINDRWSLNLNASANRRAIKHARPI